MAEERGASSTFLSLGYFNGQSTEPFGTNNFFHNIPGCPLRLDGSSLILMRLLCGNILCVNYIAICGGPLDAVARFVEREARMDVPALRRTRFLGSIIPID